MARKDLYIPLFLHLNASFTISSWSPIVFWYRFSADNVIPQTHAISRHINHYVLIYLLV
jgi:hypothetical protein